MKFQTHQNVGADVRVERFPAVGHQGLIFFHLEGLAAYDKELDVGIGDASDGQAIVFTLASSWRFDRVSVRRNRSDCMILAS